MQVTALLTMWQIHKMFICFTLKYKFILSQAHHKLPGPVKIIGFLPIVKLCLLSLKGFVILNV